MRLPRLAISGLAQHVVVRGNNHQVIFYRDHDFRSFKIFLAQAASRYDCAIHTYVLMPNHIHLLVTPEQSNGVAKMIQLLARLYVQYFNQQYQRTGTLWEGRYKSALVDEANYALNCYRYIETNPVRSGLVESAIQYPWSSFHHNALAVNDSLLSASKVYRQLAANTVLRASKYLALCAAPLESKIILEIRNQTNRSRVLGDEQFVVKVEQLLGINLHAAHRGGDRRSAAYCQSRQCFG